MKLTSCCKLQHRRAVIVNLWENLMLVTAGGYSYQPLHPSSHHFWFYVNLIPNQERKHILLFCAVVFLALHRRFLIHKPDYFWGGTLLWDRYILTSHGYLSVVGKWWKQTVQLYWPLFFCMNCSNSLVRIHLKRYCCFCFDRVMAIFIMHERDFQVGGFFSSCLLCGKIKTFSFETLRLYGPTDESGSNQWNPNCFQGESCIFCMVQRINICNFSI